MDGSSALHDQELLAVLGLVSSHGRLSSHSQRKLAQVNGLLSWLHRAVRVTQQAHPSVVEFGCGKAYLAFFLAQAVRDARESPVSITGVDRNLDLIARCRRARDLLGWQEMAFTVATCESFDSPHAPALVCALHACDVATDHVIAAAIAMGAEHVVVAPCCHSTSQRRLREAGHRHEWGRIARCFPLLGSRFSEFVTEAMRCLALRTHGYEVQVREFVSGTATPKNTVIIASLTGKPSKRSQDELRKIEDLVGLECEVRRSLERRAAARHAGEPGALSCEHQHQEEEHVCRI